jgi:hypothetical protein
MLNISVEKQQGSMINIAPMSIKRDWMDATPEKHAYRCFPVSQANMVGWSLSCKEDIRFIWNGINDTSSENIKLLEPKGYLYTSRGQSTISLTTGLVFRSETNTSLLTINPVNFFSTEFETMSSLISTSFYDNPLPLAIKAKVPNKEVIIKSGTPIATIIPVSLSSMDNTSIEIFNYLDPENKRQDANKSYGDAAQKINGDGQWTDWYRDAVNEKGESLGSHETKVLHLFVNDNTENQRNGII